MADMPDRIWSLQVCAGPVVATAIHDGHAVRSEVADHLALSAEQRRREEDPYTAVWTAVAPTRVIGLRSRFEVDLNRPREQAVYRTPEDAWGLAVWRNTPPEPLFARSLAEYDDFYRHMGDLLAGISRECGRFVVLDLHSYNHLRAGPQGPPADPEGNPQVNVGTRTMNRERWAPVVGALLDALRSFDFPGGRLDVRENVKFFGGNWPRWIHQQFPDTGVALAIEFKKFFMNEWTGETDEACLAAIFRALESVVPAVQDALERC